MSSKVFISLRVPADPTRAFEVFTSEIALWWQPDPLFQLTARWLHLMDLQEALLRTHPAFMVGTWLSYVQPWASSADEARRLSFDARSLLTTWGDRHASEEASLHDYGNKDWSGLTGDYYKARWQAYFDALKGQLRTGTPALSIDWFAFGDRWNRDTHAYPTVPTGDTRQIAAQIAREVQ